MLLTTAFHTGNRYIHFYLWRRNRFNWEIGNLCWSCFWWQSFFDTLNLVSLNMPVSPYNTKRTTPQVLLSHCSFVEKLSCQRKCFFPLSLDVQYYMSLLAQVLIVTYFHLGGRKMEILWTKPFFIKRQAQSMLPWWRDLVEAQQSLAVDTQVARHYFLP